MIIGFYSKTVPPNADVAAPVVSSLERTSAGFPGIAIEESV
jgi:hypothetical protein